MAQPWALGDVRWPVTEDPTFSAAEPVWPLVGRSDQYLKTTTRGKYINQLNFVQSARFLMVSMATGMLLHLVFTSNQQLRS